MLLKMTVLFEGATGLAGQVGACHAVLVEGRDRLGPVCFSYYLSFFII